MDLNLVMAYWGKEAQRTYHHTAPVNAIYALHKALALLQEEGLEQAWARHQRNYQVLRAGLDAMGLKFLVDEPFRLPQMNSVWVPRGIDEARIRNILLREFNLEIGAGLGPLAGKIWRIGLMGHTSTIDNIMLCLRALDEILMRMGAEFNYGKAVSAAKAA